MTTNTNRHENVGSTPHTLYSSYNCILAETILWHNYKLCNIQEIEQINISIYNKYWGKMGWDILIVLSPNTYPKLPHKLQFNKLRIVNSPSPLITGLYSKDFPIEFTTLRLKSLQIPLTIATGVGRNIKWAIFQLSKHVMRRVLLCTRPTRFSKRKWQSAGRHINTLGHIIPTPRRPIFALTS